MGPGHMFPQIELVLTGMEIVQGTLALIVDRSQSSAAAVISDNYICIMSDDLVCRG